MKRWIYRLRRLFAGAPRETDHVVESTDLVYIDGKIFLVLGCREDSKGRYSLITTHAGTYCEQSTLTAPRDSEGGSAETPFAQ